MKPAVKQLSIFVIVTLLFNYCSTVPIIGRKQMNLLPESTMLQMSLTNYQAFLKENKISRDLKSTRMVQDAGSRIAAAVTLFLKKNGMEADIANYQWEFNLVADTTPNAWCMPGGKVVVFEGILPVTQNETGIAVVMGHEIAHAVAHHGNERMSEGLVQQLGGMALEKAVETQPQQTRQIFQVAYGIGSQIGFMLPYSRLHESEADRLGLILMAMAKYDPNAAVAFWERMARASKGPKPPVWLSTHPLDETRISSLKTNLPEAMKFYQEAITVP
jgi:predicted Zn-dependent protease